MANIRITDKQTVTPTGSDFMLINQAGSDKNTTLARLKTYMNGSTTLETVAQDTNSAINEVNAKATDASTGINGIKNTIGSGNLETTSQNIIGAVNEVNTKVGNEKLETVAENATGAINELNKKIGNVDIENDGDIATQLNENAQIIQELEDEVTKIKTFGKINEFHLSNNLTFADTIAHCIEFDEIFIDKNDFTLQNGVLHCLKSGSYIVQFSAHFSGGGACSKYIQMYCNGSYYATYGDANGNDSSIATFVELVNLGVGSTMSFNCLNTSGTSYTISNSETRLKIVKVSDI